MTSPIEPADERPLAETVAALSKELRDLRASARMRAVEEGLPLVRAANTGISAVVDPFGRVTALLELGEQGIIDASLPRPLRATLYARFGDWMPLAMLVASWTGYGLLRRTRPTSSQKRGVA